MSRGAPFSGTRALLPFATVAPERATGQAQSVYPVLVFIFFVQRYLVRGLTFGAVKSSIRSVGIAFSDPTTG